MAAHDSRCGYFFNIRGEFFGQTFQTHLHRKLRVVSRLGEGRKKKARNTLAAVLPCGINIYSKFNSTLCLPLKAPFWHRPVCLGWRKRLRTSLWTQYAEKKTTIFQPVRVTQTFRGYIHLIPKWRPINDSFVCMLVSPLRLVNMYKKQKTFEVKMRRRGLINMQTKE